MDKIVKLVKVQDYLDEFKFFYYVENGSEKRRYFSSIVEAEKYIKELGAKYDFYREYRKFEY